MVIISTYYSSNNLRQQVKISENAGRKQYIAEIARSIFSAMQVDLLNARRNIMEGPFFYGLFPLKTRIDEISPIAYLQGDVEIRSIPSVFAMSTSRSTIANGRGPCRPAQILLTIPDECLKNEFLPKITELCEKYGCEHKLLNGSLNSLIQKSSFFFEDFKKYCDFLDKDDLKGIFELQNSQSPS